MSGWRGEDDEDSRIGSWLRESSSKKSTSLLFLDKSDKQDSYTSSDSRSFLDSILGLGGSEEDSSSSKNSSSWWKADPGFGERFWAEFHRSRLPGAKWWSVAPPIGPLTFGATYYGAEKLESMALRSATGRFASFSGTRSFVYMSGYRPAFFVAAKTVRYANIALLIPTAFYTGADIGTAIHSAIEAWKE